MAPNGMWTTGTTRKSDCHAAVMAAAVVSAVVVSGVVDPAAVVPGPVLVVPDPAAVVSDRVFAAGSSAAVTSAAPAAAACGGTRAGSAQSKSISAPRFPAKTSARAAISVLCRSSAARKTSARLAAYSSSAHGAEVSRHSISAASSVSAWAGPSGT
jgi:hypothetical protein